MLDIKLEVALIVHRQQVAARSVAFECPWHIDAKQFGALGEREAQWADQSGESSHWLPGLQHFEPLERKDRARNSKRGLEM